MTIDALEPPIRERVIASFVAAMQRGSRHEVEGLLQLSQGQELSVSARCHVRMMAAHLAYLDADFDSALALTELDRADLDALPPALRVTLQSNRTMVRALSPQGFDRDELRQSADEKETVRTLERSGDSLLDALRAARAGKHFEALPGLNAYFAESYWTGDWLRLRDAASELSHENLLLADIPAGAYFALIACDEKAAAAAGDACIGPTELFNVGVTVRELMSRSRLRQHARTLIGFIEHAADAIPDDDIDVVGEFLLGWTAFKREFAGSLNVSAAAWDALRRVGARVSTVIADRALIAALASPSWGDKSGVDREHVIRALVELVDRATEPQLAEFAREVCGLTKPETRGEDYHHVLHLLWRLADRSPAAKSVVVSELFGEPRQAPASLLQLGALLGKKIQDTTEFNAFAMRMADRIRAQVSIVAPGDPQPANDGFGVFSFDSGGKRVAVQMSNFGPSLQGLLKYVNDLSDEAVSALLSAMVDSAATPLNIVANKAELVHYIGRFAARATTEQRRSIVEVLEPIARGQSSDPAADVSGSAKDPLNPFKFDFGDLADLQGATIVCLATLEGQQPAEWTSEIQAIVVTGLANTAAEVRRMSYIAAGRLSALTDAIITGLLVGTRDASPEAAATALHVLAASDRLDLTESQLDYLLQALHIASVSANKQLRVSAAASARALTNGKRTDGVRREAVEQILARLGRDPLHSVRSRAIGEEP
jgi:hypothetical protein